MILYDAVTCSFYTIKKPSKNLNCPVCSTTTTIIDDNTKTIPQKIRSMEDSYNNLSLASSRGPHQQTDQIGLSNDSDVGHNISCQDYKASVLDTKIPHILLDVRVPCQYEMCSLPNAINVPLRDIDESKIDNIHQLICTHINSEDTPTGNDNATACSKTSSTTTMPIYCICRRGIASKQAVKLLYQLDPTLIVYNISGGLNSWHRTVDSSFPHY
jgi:adenylyltransferase and sulfurtransferase